MTRKLSLAAMTLAAGLLFASAPGMAVTSAPLSTLKSVGAAQSAIDKAHFWHRTCRRGLNGWHKHVPGVGRVQCTNHICRHGRCWWY